MGAQTLYKVGTWYHCGRFSRDMDVVKDICYTGASNSNGGLHLLEFLHKLQQNYWCYQQLRRILITNRDSVGTLKRRT